MAYEFALNHDNAAGLTVVSVQPKSPGLMYPQRDYGLDLSIVDQGMPYTVWEYTGDGKLHITDEEYAALLLEFGLSTVLYKDCTIRTTDEFHAFGNYNARIHRPQNGKTATYAGGGFWADVTFQIVQIEAIT